MSNKTRQSIDFKGISVFEKEIKVNLLMGLAYKVIVESRNFFLLRVSSAYR